jgi:hypothetical protein
MAGVPFDKVFSNEYLILCENVGLEFIVKALSKCINNVKKTMISDG